MSHVLGSFGTTVTIITLGEHLLSRYGADIWARFTETQRPSACVHPPGNGAGTWGVYTERLTPMAGRSG